MKRDNMNTISISDIQRNLHKIENLDIVEIVDKKRHQVKGYFLDKKYHDFVEELFHTKEIKKQKILEEFHRLSQNVSVLEDKTIDICKADEEMYSDIF
jgi:hypothetical protein